VGAVNGLFGGGGGMVAVPALINGLNYSPKRAHATAILIILPVCAATSVLYILGGYADLNVVVPSIIGSVAGGLLGAVFLGKLPEEVTNVAFICIMLAAGIRMAVG